MVNSKSRIYVTGGLGYIGSHLSLTLKKAGYPVVVIDNSTKDPAFLRDQGIELISLDLSSDLAKSHLKELFQSSRPGDCVIHLSAKKSVAESVKNPELYWYNNVQSTKNLLDAFGHSQMSKLIFSSTAAVYGGVDGIVSEKTELSPASPYAETKLVEEKLIQEFSERNDVNIALFRFFNVIGARSLDLIETSGENLIPTALRALDSGSTLEIFGDDYNTADGTCVRDYVDVEDITEALALSVEKLEMESLGPVNLGTGKGSSVQEIIGIINRRSTRKLNFKYSERRSGDMALLVASNQLAFEKLGWKPSRTVESSLTHLIQELESQ